MADLLVRLRAVGVPVVVLADAAGVNQERVRAVCRDHGPDPATVGEPLADIGWVGTRAAALLLGVFWERLRDTSAEAVKAGVCAPVGWYLQWHAPSLPAWWADIDPGAAEVNRRGANKRAARVQARVAAGATQKAVAAAEGVHVATVARDLRRYDDWPNAQHTDCDTKRSANSVVRKKGTS